MRAILASASSRIMLPDDTTDAEACTGGADQPVGPIDLDDLSGILHSRQDLYRLEGTGADNIS
jgi:hypothetical protein